jgi:SAM-dependent methyltransferase
MTTSRTLSDAPPLRSPAENPPAQGKFLPGGEAGAGMALARLLMRHRDLATVRRRLRAAGDGEAARLLALLDANEATARSILAILDSPLDRAGGGTVEAELARCRELFDWAVRLSPEASVAFYSLGDAALLGAATAEVMELLDRLGLLRPGHDVLDLGCGIGRLALAMAPRVRSVTGIDLSPGMVEEARRRGGDLANVRFEQAGGRDLAGLADGGFDLVLAADSLPYVFRAGGEALLAAMLAETARVLRAGGELLALNLTYRGDPDADHAFLHAHAGACGLAVVGDGAAPLTSWDGLAFRLRKAG